MKATAQLTQSTVSPGVPFLKRALLVASAVALLAVLLVAFAYAGTVAIGTTAPAVDRAAADSLIQVRQDEFRERYTPSVEDIRRSLIQFRRDEREERWER